MAERLQLLFNFLDEEEDLLLILLKDAVRNEPQALYATRDLEGFQKTIIERHLLNDDAVFRKIFRLNIHQFNYVLSIIEDELKGKSCGYVKQPINLAEKLGITLRVLATGESYALLSFAFRISPSYISRIVKDVLQICSERLPALFMPTPTTENLITAAKEFEEKWNFPNCIAAVDGKHVRIFCPGKSGSLFFNYKDFFSIVLLAFVDANYKFIMIDTGSFGKEGDSGIIEKSAIGKLLKHEEFYPPPRQVTDNLLLPFVIVGDAAVKLSTHMLKPYTRNDTLADIKKCIFNYRLSRARRVSENSFALLSQVFGGFYTPIAINPNVTNNLIMTTCCLHNMLRDACLEEKNACFFQLSNSDKLPTENLIALRAGGGFGNAEGFGVREAFTDYFSSDIGSVPWQLKHAKRTDKA